MPRAQKLSQLTPNKVYSIEGTVKFKHQSQGYTTLVIEQDSVQKKIKIPSIGLQVEEGANYRFKNCFYNSKGWLTARKPNQSIESIRISDEPAGPFALNLQEIKHHIDNLENKYFSTYLKIYSFLSPQTLRKDGKDLKFQVLKCYSTGCLVDVTIWNTELDAEKLIGQWVLFEGIRVKKMNQDKFVLASTVFTKWVLMEGNFDDQFAHDDLQKYENLSEIYKKRIIADVIQLGIPNNKVFSIIRAKVKSIITADYQGCPKCKRKIQSHCQNCNISTKMNCQYGKVTLEDTTGTIQVIVFDQKIRDLFKFAKENCEIEGKIKTFGRIEEEEAVVSHILTKIDSIFF